ncbi:hypothetical protein [Rhizobium leguminosarum]|uniref:hypothetical protein n=1 Tax=Rhizobium leguminosarum TaxID=384 RepID=UPI001039B39C|nr:hypothetical protein [Rhizobium leguminosarum]TBY27440.1 hypothetical protein E0H55_27510 [Rhizobium leguminosarum bv. viciae]
MAFTDEFIETTIAEDGALRRLQNKVTGGKSNDTGLQFEARVMVEEIVKHAVSYRFDRPVEGHVTAHHPSAVLLTQGVRAYVDDIRVETPELDRFLQLKTGNFAWDADIQTDFKYQGKLCTAAGRPFRLELVVDNLLKATQLPKSKSQYRAPEAIVRWTMPTTLEMPPSFFKDVEYLFTGVATKRAIEIASWCLELAWTKSNRHELLSDTLGRAKELAGGTLLAFDATSDWLSELIARIRATDREVLKLFADGRTIVFDLDDGENFFTGSVHIANWCAFEQAAQTAPPETARELIVMATEGVAK